MNKVHHKKLEKKLIAVVDGNGRAKAESLINTQFRELLEDVSELIAKAAMRNPDNPWAELSIDKASMERARALLYDLYERFDSPSGLSRGQKLAKRTAMRDLRNTLNRLDICYLVSSANLAERYNKELKVLKKRVNTTLLHGVRPGAKFAEPESAMPSGRNRKYVPEVSAKRLREDAKLLSGKRLQTKVLNVVESRLSEFEDAALGQNAVRVHGALRPTLRGVVNSTVSVLKRTPNITSRELEEAVYGELLPKFGGARNVAKIASRAVVSAELNLAITDEVERLVNEGHLENEAFFSNKPSFVYKAVMDSRTSDICRALNGLVIPLSDKARLTHYMPPKHANCRSMLIPNLRGIA